MSRLDTFDRILASLHQAMLDDVHWPSTSALIEAACGATGNALVVGEGVGDDVCVFFAGYYRRGERRHDLEREYFDLYHPHDERLPRLRQLPDSRLVHVPDLYSEQELKTSPVYNEGLRRIGSQRGLNVRLDGPAGSRIVWALGDPIEAGGWGAADIDMAERLLPHIRHFVSVRQALAAAEGLGAGLSRLLDNSRIGVLHLDRRGRLVAANDRALALLQRGEGLLDQGGFLHAWLPADHSRLQRLLARALPAFEGESPRGGSMTVRRPSGAPRLGLHVSPLAAHQTDLGGRGVAVLVLVVDPARHARISGRRVAVTLGLTPVEGRVAALLAEGRSVRDIAQATVYQEGYVRWLLKQVYRKHGLPGRVALVRLVLAMDALPRR